MRHESWEQERKALSASASVTILCDSVTLLIPNHHHPVIMPSKKKNAKKAGSTRDATLPDLLLVMGIYMSDLEQMLAELCRQLHVPGAYYKMGTGPDIQVRR